MPNVVINLKAGRSIERKQKLHEAVARAVAESLEIDIAKVRIQLLEMHPGDVSYAGVIED